MNLKNCYGRKDLENKRLMENPVQLPKDQQDHLSQIREIPIDDVKVCGYLHSEINGDLKIS